MSADDKRPEERCKLQAKQGIEAWCTRDKCIFWRLLDAQDINVSNRQGCGLQYFRMVEKLDPETAAWLLQMKRKLEDERPDEEKSRINFRLIE